MAGVSGSWGEGTARGEPVPGLLEILAGTAATPPVVLEALPGLTWSYSGGGYLIVAQVICDVTGLVLDEAMAELVLEPAGMTASTFRQPLPGSLEPAAAWGYHGGEPVPGGWRNQPDTGAVGLWTTPSGPGPVRSRRQRRPVGGDAAPAPRGASHGQRGVPRDQRSRRPLVVHSGLVTGYASLLACTGSFAVAIMSNDSRAEDLIAELFGDVAVSRGPGPVELTNLFGESIRRWIEMTARQDRFVGTYVLPWGAEVHVTAPMGQHAPELHLTLPGQPPVRLLPATPHRWYMPGIAAPTSHSFPRTACASPSTAASSTPGAHGSVSAETPGRNLRRRNRWPSPPPSAPPRGPRRAGPGRGPCRRTSRRAACWCRYPVTRARGSTHRPDRAWREGGGEGVEAAACSPPGSTR